MDVVSYIIGLDAYFRISLKITVLITIHMRVFCNLVANLLAAVMSLWAFKAAGTKENVAHPCSRVRHD